MTIAIAFNAGAYGTYLEWCLTTLTSDSPVLLPFTANGNSHIFKGNHLTDINGWKNYVNGRARHKFVRLHPKISEQESIDETLLSIIPGAEKVIYLYPDKGSMLLNINNSYKKVWSDNWWEVKLRDPGFANNLYNNWPMTQSTPISSIPIWIQRELLSFYLMPAWCDSVDWYHLDRWHHNQCNVVLIKDLLYDFESTIAKIRDFCSLTFQRDIKDILPYHKIMLSLQQDLMQDQLGTNVIKSTLSDNEFNWEDQSLALPTQSWIQWELRNHGFEIRCNGLDTFPTNSIQLRELLYSV